MFVIEKLRSDYRTKVENWERARDKFQSKTEYSYEMSGYEDRHPHPNRVIKLVTKTIAVIFAAIIAVGGPTLLAISSRPSEEEKQKTAQEKTVKEEANKKAEEEAKKLAASGGEKKCGKFNLNDKVRIQYGDFVGNVGKVIGGCEEDEAYQVKIDDGSKANLPDNRSEMVSVGGWIIDVNSDENLVKIQEEK